MNTREERIARLRAFRLVPAEADRVAAAALLCLAFILPASYLAKFGGPSDRVPVKNCVESASLVNDELRCSAAGRPVSPTAALLMGVPLNLNTVDAQSLQVLDGIGPALSARIVADRDENGPFDNDLQRVRGIGPKTASRIAPFVR